MVGFAVSLAEIAVEKKQPMCSADINDVGKGNYFEFLVVAIAYVVIWKSKQHKRKIRHMEWSVALDEESYSVPGRTGIVLAHDIHCAHPNEQSRGLLSMPNRLKPAIGEIEARFWLASRVCQLGFSLTNNLPQLWKAEFPFLWRCRYPK